MAEPRVPYTKQSSPPQVLITHWESQGLRIPDHAVASHYLQFIGYYRLRGYARYFQNLKEGPGYHDFYSGTTFEQIIDLYKFDRKLRASLMDALEKIEVSIRTVISETASLLYGPHWYMNAASFKDQTSFDKTSETLRKLLSDNESEKKHGFLMHYRSKYSSPDLPPSWMVFEVLSFGNISHIYAGISSRLKKDVASVFNVSPPTLASWIRSLSYLRNLCAHHCRVWNRTFTIKPEHDQRIKTYQIPGTDRFYILASIIHYFLHRIKGAPGWTLCVRDLVGPRPQNEQVSMGFPSHWQTLSAWIPPVGAVSNLANMF